MRVTFAEGKRKEIEIFVWEKMLIRNREGSICPPLPIFFRKKCNFSRRRIQHKEMQGFYDCVSEK
ncbi:MAG: hypothetical protein QW203_04960 [Thermoplasmatales archaeon]